MVFMDANTLEMKGLEMKVIVIVALQAFIYHESLVSVKRLTNQESDNLFDAQHDLFNFATTQTKKAVNPTMIHCYRF